MHNSQQRCDVNFGHGDTPGKKKIKIYSKPISFVIYLTGKFVPVLN
jgi:hypothetical protein